MRRLENANPASGVAWEEIRVAYWRKQPIDTMQKAQLIEAECQLHRWKMALAVELDKLGVIA